MRTGPWGPTLFLLLPTPPAWELWDANSQVMVQEVSLTLGPWNTHQWGGEGCQDSRKSRLLSLHSAVCWSQITQESYMLIPKHPWIWKPVVRLSAARNQQWREYSPQKLASKCYRQVQPSHTPTRASLSMHDQSAGLEGMSAISMLFFLFTCPRHTLHFILRWVV